MSASAAARGVLGTPPAKTAFLDLPTGGNAARQFGSNVRYVTKPRNWKHSASVVSHHHRLSDITARRYGSKTPYFIPPTFLYKVRRGITPHICQIAALSEITGYRFVEWMQMFGFDLHQIPFLQVRLHPESHGAHNSREFRNRSLLHNRHASAIQHLFYHGGSINTYWWPNLTDARYCLAKIGNRDL